MLVLPDGPMRQRLTANLPVLISELPAEWQSEDAALALQIMGWLAFEQVKAGVVPPAPALAPGRLRFVKQQGVSQMWGAVDVHPMQATETAFREQVRRAGDAAAAAHGEDARRVATWDVMQRYFRFVSASQALTPMTAFDDPTPPLVEDQLRRAVQWLKRSEGMARTWKAVNGNRDLTPITMVSVRQTIEEARVGGVLVIGHYSDAEREMRGPLGQIPMPAARPTVVRQAENDLGAAAARILLIGTGQDSFDAAAKLMKKALTTLGTAGDGLATAQSLYFIDGFYLFRLLVRYRYESDLAISDDLKTKMSDALTKMMHTNTPWLRDFLRWAIADLAAFIEGVAGDDAVFFLKGGRALEYALGDWTRGTNDWDTQVVVNPSLPPEQWYRRFNDVQNVVIQRLNEYRRRFMLLLASRAQDLVNTVCPPPPAVGGGGGAAADGDDDGAGVPAMPEPPEVDLDDDPASTAAFRANCKAELIDVGMARRDSAEAIEQWRLMKGRIVEENGVPIPPADFFMVDFLLILREVLAGKSHSVHKATKRVKRLNRLIEAWDEAVFGTAWMNSMTALLPLSTHLVTQFAHDEVRRLGWFSLYQFVEAYDLFRNRGDAELPGLAEAFDKVFSGNYQSRQSPPGWLPALDNDVMPNLDGAEQSLFLALGSVAWISTVMEAHFVQRAQVLNIADPGGDTLRFVQGMNDDVLFGPNERNELRIGVADALAASLHATALVNDGAAAVQGLEPVTQASLRVLSVNAGNSGGLIIGLLSDRVSAYLAQHPPVQAMTIYPGGPIGNRSWLALRLEQSVNFGTVHNEAFDYAPNLVMIDANPVTTGWPMLDSIGRSRVMTLRDLVLSYRQRIGKIDEYGRREVLHAAERAITGMLMDYEAPARPVHLLP